jgi:mono/diheme cytochrome c family protein
MMHCSPTALPLLLAVGLAPSICSQDPANAQLTFTRDIAPIVFNNCTTCHRPGEAGPFPLMTYRDLRKRGPMIERVTESRFMPPWHPVAGHGEFAGAIGLSDEQIALIGTWVRSGMAQGDPADLPEMPEFAEGWKLGEPDLVVTMTEGYQVPAGGPDIYRNFFIPVNLPEDKWLTAIEVRPSARAVLHHTLFSLDTSGRAQRREGSDGHPGFFGGAGGENLGTSTSGLGGWAVGGQARMLPEGLAREMPAGSDLILNSHFHPSGKAEVEQTTLGLYFADEPPARTMVGLQMPPGYGFSSGLHVPPGEEDFTLNDSFELPVDVQAVSVGGHAHYICKKMQIVATLPDGERRSIFYIDNWAFNWQNRYRYSELLDLPEGTVIDCTITYDNSTANPNNPNDPPDWIHWGLQSSDEMGSVTLLLVAAREEDTTELKQGIRAHRREIGRGSSATSGLSSLLSRIKMLDLNVDGTLDAEEIPDVYRRRVLQLDSDRDGALSAAEISAIEDRLVRLLRDL